MEGLHLAFIIWVSLFVLLFNWIKPEHGEPFSSLLLFFYYLGNISYLPAPSYHIVVIKSRKAAIIFFEFILFGSHKIQRIIHEIKRVSLRHLIFFF